MTMDQTRIHAALLSSYGTGREQHNARLSLLLQSLHTSDLIWLLLPWAAVAAPQTKRHTHAVTSLRISSIIIGKGARKNHRWHSKTNTMEQQQQQQQQQQPIHRAVLRDIAYLENPYDPDERDASCISMLATRHPWIDTGACNISSACLTIIVVVLTVKS
jgi:hypothetical protein